LGEFYAARFFAGRRAHDPVCDASGGVGADSYTLAVGHKEGENFVIDLGKDTVDHGRNGHDDHANAVCGVLCKMSNHLGYNILSGAYDWDDRREPINLPLGYTRETYEAELARRAHIYANWGKTT